MKVKIFALEYGGLNFDSWINNNMYHSGYPIAEFHILNIAPLSKALNTGLSEFQKGYDFIGFLANDIQEPKNWLIDRITHLINNPHCGIVSIYPGEVVPTGSPDIIGNYLIRKELFNKIGCFTEEFENYGPIDLDYCTRARVAGFSSDYISAGAIHHDKYDDTVYGFSKKEAVDKSWPVHVQNVNEYNSGKKNPVKKYPEYIINQNDWP